MSSFDFRLAELPEAAPLQHSAAVTQIERELKDIFVELFAMVGKDTFDAGVLGAAHLGSFDLVRKMVNHDGLVLLRGAREESATRYLYRAWKSGDVQKRGLHFVRTYLSATGWKLAVTAIGEVVPAGAICLYNITIPANSTDATDPNLANVTITSVRRVEAGFPQFLDTPVSQFVPISTLSANDWRIDIDVVSADGAPCDRKALNIASRASNGFTLELASAADNVRVRYRVSKLNN